MGVINYYPVRPGVYRRVWRKKSDSSRRKPLGPPISGFSRSSMGVTPFHRLPVHLQALCGKDRSSGERED